MGDDHVNLCCRCRCCYCCGGGGGGNCDGGSDGGSGSGGSSGDECDKKEDGGEDPDKEVLGFDTRFCYTREGLVVYDVHANIKLDKKWNENSGLTNEDYKAF